METSALFVLCRHMQEIVLYESTDEYQARIHQHSKLWLQETTDVQIEQDERLKTHWKMLFQKKPDIIPERSSSRIKWMEDLWDYIKEINNDQEHKDFENTFSSGLENLIEKKQLLSAKNVEEGVGTGVKTNVQLKKGDVVTVYGGDNARVVREWEDIGKQDEAYVADGTLQDGTYVYITSPTKRKKEGGKRHFSVLLNHQWKFEHKGANVRIETPTGTGETRRLPFLIATHDIEADSFLYWNYGVAYWMATLFGYKEDELFTEEETLYFEPVMYALLPNIGMFGILTPKQQQLFFHFWSDDIRPQKIIDKT